MSRLIPAAVAVVALAGGGSARASDYAPVYQPAPGFGAVAAPAYEPLAEPAYGPVVGGCASCGAKVGKCKTCGSILPLHRHEKNPGPYVVQLCPGACFGYFQTQWRKWDEVCPYPYQGHGVTDVPKPPSEYLPSARDRLPPQPKPKVGTLQDPRPVDPKTGTPMPMPPGTGLPPIPPAPPIGY